MNQLQQLYLDSLGQVLGLDRKYAEIAIKTALPSWDQVQTMVRENKENLIAAGIGAAVTGGSSALYSTKKDWETEEEFRRRRASSAMGAGLIGAAVGGFARPTYDRISKMFAPPTADELAKIKERESIQRNKELGDAVTAIKDDAGKVVDVADKMTHGVKADAGAIIGGLAGGRLGLSQVGGAGDRSSVARRLMNVIDKRPTASLTHAPASLASARDTWTRTNVLNTAAPGHTPGISIKGKMVPITPSMISPGVGEAPIPGANRYGNRAIRSLGRGGMASIPALVGAGIGYAGGTALDNRSRGDQGSTPGM